MCRIRPALLYQWKIIFNITNTAFRYLITHSVYWNTCPILFSQATVTHQTQQTLSNVLYSHCNSGSLTINMKSTWPLEEHISVTGWQNRKLSSLDLPRTCPLILMIKLASRQSEDLRSEEGKVIRSGFFEYVSEVWMWEFEVNFEFWIWRLNCDEILINVKGLGLGNNEIYYQSKYFKKFFLPHRKHTASLY